MIYTFFVFTINFLKFFSFWNTMQMFVVYIYRYKISESFWFSSYFRNCIFVKKLRFSCILLHLRLRIAIGVALSVHSGVYIIYMYIYCHHRLFPQLPWLFHVQDYFSVLALFLEVSSCYVRITCFLQILQPGNYK